MESAPTANNVILIHSVGDGAFDVPLTRGHSGGSPAEILSPLFAHFNTRSSCCIFEIKLKFAARMTKSL